MRRLWVVIVAASLGFGVLGFALLAGQGGSLLDGPGCRRFLWRAAESGQPPAPVACPNGPSPRRFVALTFGQSNGANYAQGRHAALPQVYFYEGSRCSAGRDPLPGAGGSGGSVWSRLGYELVRSGRYDTIVFAGIAVSATGMAQWRVGGLLHASLISALQEMRAQGLEPTHLLWQQGETDAKQQVPAATYRQLFLAMAQSIREAGFSAPLYIAVSTYCKGRRSDEIRHAQIALAHDTPELHLRPGPDTDALRGPRWRYDDCHFSSEGASAAAVLWARALGAE